MLVISAPSALESLGVRYLGKGIYRLKAHGGLDTGLGQSPEPVKVDLAEVKYYIRAAWL